MNDKEFMMDILETEKSMSVNETAEKVYKIKRKLYQ